MATPPVARTVQLAPCTSLCRMNAAGPIWSLLCRAGRTRRILELRSRARAMTGMETPVLDVGPSNQKLTD